MRKKLIWIVPAALAGIVLFTALGGWIVMSLWNWLLPPLFGWHTLTFWQAWGLLALCRILFGGLGLHGGPRSRVGERVRDRIRDRVAERMAERCAAMSPEERERFRQIMGERYGFGSPSGERPPQ